MASLRKIASHVDVSDRAAVLVGYATLLFVCQMAIWGGLELTNATGLSFMPLLSWWSVPLCASIGIVMLGAAVAIAAASSRACLALDERQTIARCLGAAAPVAMLVGFAAIAIPSSPSVAMICAGAIASGLGIGLSFLLWALVFSKVGKDVITPLILGALLVSSLFQFPTFSAPSAVLDALYCIAIVASAVLFFFVANKQHARAPRHSTAGLSNDSASHSMRSMALAARNPLFCAASIAFAVAVTRIITLSTNIASSGAVTLLSIACIALGSICLLILFRRANASKLSVSKLFQVLFPAVATLLLALSVVGMEKLGIPVAASIFAIYTLVSALMIPVCFEGAWREGLNPLGAYGIFAGVVYLVFAAATFLGIFVFSDASSANSTVALTAILIVLYVLAMAYAAVRRKTSEPEATAESETPTNTTADNEAKGGRTAGRNDSFGAKGDEGLQDSAVGNGEVAVDTSEADSRDAEKRLADNADSEKNTTQAQKDSVRSESAQDLHPEDIISKRCALVAQRYGLSARESEVLDAFAHGRNVAYLAEQLFLSPNTIRSHSKTLYAKLGVHSKQELIDLVDAADQQ